MIPVANRHCHSSDSARYRIPPTDSVHESSGQHTQGSGTPDAMLAARIRAHLHRGHLRVKLTDNRYTMLSVRRENHSGTQSSAHGGPCYHVRLHHMFADASPAVTRALAQYIGLNDPAAAKILGDFIDANQHRVRPKQPRSNSNTTQGVHHDLQQLFDKLNQQYFNGQISATIGWGQKCGKARRRKSIKMGSYSIEEQSIRIHRSLDKSSVPSFFVESIIYHEMLHQVHRAERVNGRHQFHTAAFLADEALFEHHALSRKWERDHLEQLLYF